MDPIEDFRAAIEAAGILPPERIRADGMLHRFSTNGKPSDDAGWYVFHPDNPPAGRFGCWRNAVDEAWSASGRELTSAERKALRVRMETIRRQRDEEAEHRHREAAQQARRLWEKAPPAPDDHAYLASKGVKTHGLRLHGGKLLVPMRDMAGELRSIQTIDAGGSKRFLPGGRTKGCCHVIGEIDAAETLCIAEGYATGAAIHEATGHAVAVAFTAGNLERVARDLRERRPDAKLILCADDDHGTNSNPGLSAAAAAARAAGGLLAVPDFGPERQEGNTDFCDLALQLSTDDVMRAIDNAEPPLAAEKDPWSAVDQWLEAGDCGDVRGILDDLAALPDLDYDQRRKQVADVAGVRVSTLDKERGEFRALKILREVEAQCAKLSTRNRDPAAAPVTVVEPDPEPWGDPVDGADLLDEIADTLRRHVILPDHAAETVALWTLHTYVYGAFSYTPRLLLTSPDKRCGKSRLLRFVGAMSARALPSEGVTAASLFRSIEAYRPTFLLDEADTYLRGRDVSEELRGVLNAGHQRGGRVVRCVGESYEPTPFSVFAPVALAMIGHPPGTIEDRSIVVPMRRRTRGEAIERLRPGRSLRPWLEPVRRRCLRWGADHAEALGEADPVMPGELDDRAADNWLPLLAIADEAGGGWPEKARRAAVASAESRAEGDTDSAGVMVLADLRDVFRSEGADRLTTEDILRHLTRMDDRPWPEFGRSGKPITPRGLARLLKPYGIRPTTIRTPTGTSKGYRRDDFVDAWTRYTPTGNPSHVTETPEVQQTSGRGVVTDGGGEGPVLRNGDPRDDANDLAERESIQAEDS